MDFQKPHCEICGLPRGRTYDHSKCSKELKRLHAHEHLGEEARLKKGRTTQKRYGKSNYWSKFE